MALIPTLFLPPTFALQAQPVRFPALARGLGPAMATNPPKAVQPIKKLMASAVQLMALLPTLLHHLIYVPQAQPVRFPAPVHGHGSVVALTGAVRAAPALPLSRMALAAQMLLLTPLPKPATAVLSALLGHPALLPLLFLQLAAQFLGHAAG